jgi:hypothetical protein
LRTPANWPPVTSGRFCWVSPCVSALVRCRYLLSWGVVRAAMSRPMTVATQGNKIVQLRHLRVRCESGCGELRPLSHARIVGILAISCQNLLAKHSVGIRLSRMPFRRLIAVSLAACRIVSKSNHFGAETTRLRTFYERVNTSNYRYRRLNPFLLFENCSAVVIFLGKPNVVVKTLFRGYIGR